ncbi:MAG: hypothetical protein PHF56_18100 [Desulfuromonadaceae bacterium]|nr:hypothetical protein [Desulfuromonadaceae bacterium]
MHPLLFLIIALLVLPSSAAVVQAEDFPVFNRVKGLFLYGGSQQWLNFTYDYSGNESASGSHTGHTLSESYNASLQGALFDPLILDAYLQGTIAFDQNRSSSDAATSSSRKTSYQYNFSGRGLQKSRIPFTLFSYRTTSTALNTYTTPTTNTNIGNEFSMIFLNSQLQSRLRLSRTSTDSTAGSTTNSSTSNLFSYAAEHVYGSLSTTTFSADFSDQNGGTSNGDNLTASSNSLSLANSLRFGADRTYSLLSSFQLHNTTVDSLPQRNISYSESFSAALGRALTFNAGYQLTHSRSTDLTGLALENTVNDGKLSLTHKLFDSLETELSGTASLNSMTDGTENRYSLSGNAQYNKNLPSDNRLLLLVDKRYDLVDRQLSSGVSTVRDEPHPNVHQGDTIQLALTGATLRSVTVASRNPIFTYVEGIDYTVNDTLGRITILSGGGVRIDMDGNGTDLYITYTVYVDPQIKYSTDRLSLSSSLTLFRGDMTLGGTWSQSRQNLISGPVVNGLQDSRSLRLAVSGRYDSYNGRLAYQKENTGELSSQTAEIEGTAGWQFSESTYSLTVRNAYSKYGATATTTSYRENQANLSTAYSRRLFNGQLNLQGIANDQRSDQRPTRDSLSLRIRYTIIWNMVTVNLSGQSAWLIESNNRTRNDSVRVELSRYF